MKKTIMMATFLVVLASSSQASLIRWGASGGLSANYGSSDTIYLVWDTTGNGINPLTIANITAGTFNGDDVILASGSMVANTFVADRQIIAGTVIGGHTFALSEVVGGTGQGLYNVAFDVDLTPQYAVSGKLGSFTVNNNVATPVTRTTAAGWGYNTPIPEPATMALFGVGLAVLGLRRRFMKK